MYGGDAGVIVRRFETRQAMAQAAAAHAAAAMSRAVVSRGRARIVVATGASQLEFLEDLTANQVVDWPRVTLFHLDEIRRSADRTSRQLPEVHPRSRDPETSLQDYVLLDGEGDVHEVCRRAGAAVSAMPVDVAFVGSARTDTSPSTTRRRISPPTTPTSSSSSMKRARGQQVGEGWFESISQVPESRSRCRFARF